MHSKEKKAIKLSPEQILFVIYALVTYLLLFKHEPWEDELQVWNIAQTLSIPEIFYQMRYEGHFALWYILVKCLTILHLPLFSLALLAWIFCVVPAYIFLTKSKFSFWVKSLIFLSCPVLYYFPVIARNYALIPIILTGLASYYPVRLRKPWHYGILLILLVHTHAFMCGLAGILGVLFAFELLKRPNRIKTGAVLAVIGAGVLAAFLQVAPAFGTSSWAPANFQDVLESHGFFSKAGRACRTLAELHCEGNKWNDSFVFIGVFYAALLAGWIGLLWRNWKLFVIFFFAVLWQILFGAMIYPIGLQRTYLPFLILIFCYAAPVSSRRKAPLNIQLPVWLSNGSAALALLAALSFSATVYFIRNDISKPFSNQGEMAAYIRNNVPADAKIVVFPDSLITGTFGAFLPNRIFHNSTDNQPFTLFQKVKGPPPGKIDNALLAKYAGDRKEFYMLFQLGAYIPYRLPRDQQFFDIGEYRLEIMACTIPLAFFSAGENYILLKVTGK